MRGIFLLWALHIASVTSMKLMPFKIWELSESHFGAQTRVYGGTAAKEGDYPFMVLFIVKFETGFGKCSACLLSPDWVLTAAHCLNFDNISHHNIIMIGGKSDLTDYVAQRIKNNFERSTNETNLEVQERRAQEAHIHPKYTISEDEILHDVALVKAEKPFIVTENLKPISLNFEKISSRMTCTILGWGNTPWKVTYLLHVVQEVKISTTSIGCKYTDYHKPFICLYSTGTSGICHGDSGSPLVCNQNVVGVASYFLSKNGKCEDALEDYYIELSDEKNWIKSVLNTGCKTVKIDFIRAFTFVFTALWIPPNI